MDRGWTEETVKGEGEFGRERDDIMDPWISETSLRLSVLPVDVSPVSAPLSVYGLCHAFFI